MHFTLEKVKIANFLSFYGEYEVELKPFTAVMYVWDGGKIDFLKALEFVFGANLTENPLNLVHKVLREEFLVNPDIQSYVEITIKFVLEEKQLTLNRCIKNGCNAARVEHRISNIITSRADYEDKLKSLNLNIKEKNLIFYNECFSDYVWGSVGNLEMTMSKCLREEYILDEWKEARSKVKFWLDLKLKESKLHFTDINRAHDMVEEMTSNLEDVLVNRETLWYESFSKLFYSLSDGEGDEEEEEFDEEEDVPQGRDSIQAILDDFPDTNCTEKQDRITQLESKFDSLTDKLNNLRMDIAVLTSHLHEEEIKLSHKPANLDILRNRIVELKSRIRQRETELAEVWENLTKSVEDLEDISLKISYNLLHQNEYQMKACRQNRFTNYGRFVDFLRPSSYVNLLRQIVGNEVFYAHLCDTMDTATECMAMMKARKYPIRETFIVFDHYSPHLKDALTAYGEGGVRIDTLEELLTFLCKLSHFELIDDSPVIVEKEFRYDDEMPSQDTYLVYAGNNFHFTPDGLISKKCQEDTTCTMSEDELMEDLIRLNAEEDMVFQRVQDLIYARYELLSEIDDLENCKTYLRSKCRRAREENKRTPKEPYSLPEIYKEFAGIFKQYEEEKEMLEREFPGEFASSVTHEEENESSYDYIEDSMNQTANDLKNALYEKNEVKKRLAAVTKELRLLYDNSSIIVQKSQTRFAQVDKLHKSTVFYEKEFRHLRKFIKEDNFYDFLGSLGFRKSCIRSLIWNMNNIKKKLKSVRESLDTIDGERKRWLHPLIAHLNHHLSTTFRDLMGNLIPFIEFNFTPDEENLQILTSLQEDQINITDIKHFNTFSKFMALLSVFLEIAVYDHIPIVILDEIEDFFPLQIDNEQAEAIFNESALDEVSDTHHHHFHVLMRTGQFLSEYIKKNNHGSPLRKNGSLEDRESSPEQIIYLTNGDMVHAANHVLLIHSQVLPDEYIQDDCNMYSEIHEINLTAFL